MIKIHKGEAPPELIVVGTRKTNEFKTLYDQSPECYDSGICTFDMTKEYSSELVKSTLAKRQHSKCCFSEAKFTADYPHVEHFRPKKRVDDWSTRNQMLPGYYWLAYEWSNLFYCKGRINSGNKRNFFPLKDENKRNRNHHDNYSEESLLIDPSIEDPREHIRFYRDEPISLTEKGKFNIDFLGLRHPDLIEPRRTILQYLEALRDTTEMLLAIGISKIDPIVAKNISLLKASMMPNAEFSSMATDFLSEWTQLQ